MCVLSAAGAGRRCHPVPWGRLPTAGPTSRGPSGQLVRARVHSDGTASVRADIVASVRYGVKSGSAEWPEADVRQRRQAVAEVNYNRVVGMRLSR